MIERLAWVCLGSALGGGARYLLSLAALRVLGPSFPWGTLCVNLLGAFLIGCLLPSAPVSSALPENARLFLVTGALGGLTTYSTFNHETLQLLTAGDWQLGLLNLAGTVVACLAAGTLGILAGRALLA